MNICHLISQPSVGGHQKVVTQIITEDAFDSRKYSVCCLYQQNGDLLHLFNNQKVLVSAYPFILPQIYRRPYRIWKVIRSYWPLIQSPLFSVKLDKLGIDIVHSHIPKAISGQILSCYFANKPLLITLHSQTSLSMTDRWLLPKVFNLISKTRKNKLLFSTVCPDESELQVFIRNHGFDITTVSNGVKLQDYRVTEEMRAQERSKLGLSLSDIVVGSVGRIRHIKGYDLLIDAAKICVERIPNLKFLIVGDGDEKENLQSQIKRLGLDTKIRLLGTRTDIPALLSSFDIYVQPSRSEGHPISVTEAMAAGLPIIATNCGFVPKLLPNSSGLLVSTNSHIEIANAIIKLAIDEVSRINLGEKAHKRAENFSIEKTVSGYVKLYERLIA